jgi:hypothetical protein
MVPPWDLDLQLRLLEGGRTPRRHHRWRHCRNRQSPCGLPRSGYARISNERIAYLFLQLLLHPIRAGVLQRHVPADSDLPRLAAGDAVQGRGPGVHLRRPRLHILVFPVDGLRGDLGIAPRRRKCSFQSTPAINVSYSGPCPLLTTSDNIYVFYLFICFMHGTSRESFSSHVSRLILASSSVLMIYAFYLMSLQVHDSSASSASHSEDEFWWAIVYAAVGAMVLAAHVSLWIVVSFNG